MWLKNGAISPHCKHHEKSMTKLSGSIADIFLLTYSLSSALMTSHRRHRLSIAELKQAIVGAWQQLSQAFIDRSINEWRCRLEGVVQPNGAISNICFNN